MEGRDCVKKMWERQKDSKTSSSTTKSYLAKIRELSIFTSLSVVASLCAYVCAVLGILGHYLIAPFWSKGNDMEATKIFLIVGTLMFLTIIYLFKHYLNQKSKLEKVETRFHRYQKLVQKRYKRKNNKIKELESPKG